MRFGSVCSGIEAASVAWAPLGWKAAWLSEIEPFPSAVLTHHYPDVPNLGDMLALPERIRLGEIEAPDILCGGTPCQAFSVAGLRRSLGDARGNLSLTFCEIADAIDERRSERGEPEAIIFWENVHGVLSTSDNAFGCFLAGLAGEDDPLEPPGGKWANAGYVSGPQRAIAWRVLDAQYFGVAQRRRRVFVVASAREGFDPAAVLFEFDGVRRDTPPSREEGEGATHATAPCLTSSGRGVERTGDTRGQDPVVACFGGGNRAGSNVDAACLTAKGMRQDFEVETFAIQAGALRTNPNSGPDGVGVQEGHAYTLEARAEVQAVCVTGQITHMLKAEGFDASEDGTGRGQPIVEHGTQDPCVSEHAVFALGRNNGGENAVAFAQNSRDEVRLMGGDGQIVGALAAEPGMKQTCYVAQSVSLRGREGGATAELGDEIGNCLRASGGGGDKAHVLAPVADTLYSKGIVTLKEGNASTQETYPGTLLRTLRQEVGEEAFAKWGLGILDSLQQAEVLRQALHGLSIRPASFSRSWVVYCALSRSENRAGWLLQSLREAGCERCASQGWEPSEQLAGELGAYLSELSRPGAQAARFLHDLWQASQGLGVLRQALSAVQEVGRPAGRQGQSILGSPSGRGEEGAENVLSSKVQCEVSRERVLHEARAAGEARYSRNGAVEQERSGKGWVGEAPFAVRRLTVEECEFLQGFPRGYSKIPWRKKPADDCPDGPRYKALGNSWAVPNVRWIGKRIQEALSC
jgi:DNA (cytosine-5)-methyltransferase 1